jgi:LDH2 family malate/lactate/ureidoglycolate dehydrogenase
MDEWIKTFRSAIPVKGQEKVLIPGDPEREAEIRNMGDGIKIVPSIKDDLVSIAIQLGIDFE